MSSLYKVVTRSAYLDI